MNDSNAIELDDVLIGYDFLTDAIGDFIAVMETTPPHLTECR